MKKLYTVHKCEHCGIEMTSEAETYYTSEFTHGPPPADWKVVEGRDLCSTCVDKYVAHTKAFWIGG